MKKYEAVFILDIRRADEEGEAFNRELASLITGLGGNVESNVVMGRRQFSYDIKKHKAGIYLDVIFELDTLKVIDIKNKYKLDERVLRNVIFSYEKPENARTSLNVGDPVAPAAAK